MRKTIIAIMIFLITLVPCSCTKKTIKPPQKQDSAVQSSKNEANDPPTWPQNIRYVKTSFGSSVIELNNKIYYLSSAGITLYDQTTKSDELLVTDSSALGLYKYNHSIYYFTGNSVKQVLPDHSIFTLWEMSMYSEEELLAVGCVDNIEGFFFYQEDLYILTTTISAIRVDLDTMQMEEFINDFDYLAFIGDYCYYTGHVQRTRSIYEMHLKTGDVKLYRGDGKYPLLEDGSYDITKKDIVCNRVISIKDKLFYTTLFPVVLYQCNPNGEDSVIAENLVAYYPFENLVTEDCFYYTTKDEKSGATKIYEYNAVREESRIVASFDQWYSDLIMTESFILYRENEASPFTCLAY